MGNVVAAPLLVPYINGAPYSQKVPLLFWMIHAGWFVFGVNDIWPRVLEVLIGAAQLILAQMLARRLFPQRPWVARATPWMLAGAVVMRSCSACRSCTRCC